MAMYMRMTKALTSMHRVDRGTVTERSVMAIRAREALPVRVAAVLASR